MLDAHNVFKCVHSLHVNEKIWLKCLAECLHDACFISFRFFFIFLFNYILSSSRSFALRIGIRADITYSQSSFTFKRNDLQKFYLTHSRTV